MYFRFLNPIILFLFQTVQALVAPTDLRLMETYVLYYYTLARGLVTGVIPFVALAILNFLIYMAVRRRRVFLSKAFPPKQYKPGRQVFFCG